MLSQEKQDKNKVYSLHEPSVSCIAKGKSHPRYEFGSKVIVARGAKTGVILGIQSFTGNPFTGNPHDSKLLSPLLGSGKTYCEFFRRAGPPKLYCGHVDRGFRGTKETEGIKVCSAISGKGKTPYEKRKTGRDFDNEQV